MNVPKHIAFILDGNRRWAREKKLPLMVGHTKGYGRIEPTVLHAKKLGIQYVTFWAFSTENWRREPEEVDYLMNIFRRFFKSSMIKRLKKEGARVKVLGELERFPEDIQKSMKNVINETKDNNTIVVNLAISYGGRPEILRAIREIIKNKQKDITEEIVNSYLYTAGQPDPDLIVRTGGEERLSGFLTWQSVYSELYFTEKYWPDFSIKEFDKALAEYTRRERRFGK